MQRRQLKYLILQALNEHPDVGVDANILCDITSLTVFQLTRVTKWLALNLYLRRTEDKLSGATIYFITDDGIAEYARILPQFRKSKK